MMMNYGLISAFTGSIVVAIFGVIYFKKYKRYLYFKNIIIDFTNANDEFAVFLKHETGYFCQNMLATWKTKHSLLYNAGTTRKYKNSLLNEESVVAIDTFLHHFEKGAEIRVKRNELFVVNELKNYSSFFDNVEGRKLDGQQRKAVVIDEDNNLVIAGAGSGKTTTIVGKVNYAIDRYKVDPSEILVISFTNKSAQDLSNRIQVEGVNALTFHKFGKEVIAEAEGKQPSIYDEDQFYPFLVKQFDILRKEDDYLRLVVKYFTDFIKPYKSQFEFESHGSYVRYLKDNNIRPFKPFTFKFEAVKSIEEQKIANFLALNGIEYCYEQKYEHDTATDEFSQYKPDFTIVQNGRKVYLEHFAVSRDGKVPPFFAHPPETYEDARKRYWSGITWKRSTHAQHQSVLIETYSYEMSEEILFENLAVKLTAAGIQIQPLSPQDQWALIASSSKQDISGFLRLVQTFITLAKSNNYTLIDLTSRIGKQETGQSKARDMQFLQVIKPLWESYEAHLRDRNEIDFSDMIDRASNYLSKNHVTFRCRYMLIDEFQDISIGRHRLIKAIKDTNPDCRIFCVGDDWQSIYRFTGSDIGLFKNFGEHFGCTSISKIEKTYRFNEPLLSLSSTFIQKNPNQSRKVLVGSSSNCKTVFQFAYAKQEESESAVLKNILDELMENDPDIEKKDLAILSRYGFGVDALKGTFRIELSNNEVRIRHSKCISSGIQRTVLIRFMTAHKSKGLEFDVVFIMNCNSGRYGFPTEINDDPVLNLLLSSADQYENGEERRLFYVSMTRAKEKVFFIADDYFKSKFMEELDTNCQSESAKCPYCKTGSLRKKTGVKPGFIIHGKKLPDKHWWIETCSNERYGCEYKELSWKQNNSISLNATASAPSKGGCFIATACYGTPDSPEVHIFRKFRDKKLLPSPFGSRIVQFYYKHSPPVAAYLVKRPALASSIKVLLLNPLSKALIDMKEKE